MSVEGNFQMDEINEDLIYQQMFEAVAEELYIEDDSKEETPNLDSLNFSKQEIIQIRNGGIQKFKEIMQSRFRQNIEEELLDMQQNEISSLGQIQGDMQLQQLDNTQVQNTIQRQNQEMLQQNCQIQQLQKDIQYSVSEEKENENRCKNIPQLQQAQILTPIHNKAINQKQNSQVQQQQRQNGIQNKKEQIEQVKQDEQVNKLELKQFMNNPEEAIQIYEKSIDLPTQDNQSYSQYISDREHSIEKNESKFYINSENLSPIQMQKKQKGELFHCQNQVAYFSSQNSSKEGSISIVKNNNERKQQKSKNQIINDIFSLSGIKVGQIKSMSRIGNSLSMNSSSIYNCRDFNQSALTEYHQYNNLSSLRQRSPNEQDKHIAQLYRKQQDVQDRIKKMQEEKLNLELSKLKPNTQITKGSQKILSKTNYKKPSDISIIQHKEQQEKRQKKLEEKQNVILNEELMQCTFHPQIQSKHGEDQQQPRSLNEFYQSQKDWLSAKDNNILSSQIISIQKELSETTFHPKINKQSQSQIRNLKVEEKLIQDKEKVLEKRKKMIEQNQPLFKPVILAKSQQLAKKRKEKEFLPCYEISSKFN